MYAKGYTQRKYCFVIKITLLVRNNVEDQQLQQQQVVLHQQP
jgi:hypothetical protein